MVLNKIDALPAARWRSRGTSSSPRSRALRRDGHPAFSYVVGEDAPLARQMVWPVSALHGRGADARCCAGWARLLARAAVPGSAAPSRHGALRRLGRRAAFRGAGGHVIYRPAAAGEKSFVVTRGEEGFVVEGEAVRRLVRRFDLDNEEAIRYLAEKLDRLGVYAALRAQGAQPGDDVDIEGYAFEFQLEGSAWQAEQTEARRSSSRSAPARSPPSAARSAWPRWPGWWPRSASCTREGHRMLLVSSGAVSSGMGVLRFKQRPTEVVDLQAAAAVGQGRLFHIYTELFAHESVVTAQVLLTAFDVAARTQYLNARNTLNRLLDWGVVPIINENDTTSTDELCFGDNDTLAAQVALLVKADLLVLLTDTDGLYTADPREDAERPAHHQGRGSRASSTCVQIGAIGPLGSGGMGTKINSARIATSGGVETVIARGTRPDVLKACLAGEEVGTRFLPRSLGLPDYKLWLLYGKPARGQGGGGRRRGQGSAGQRQPAAGGGGGSGGRLRRRRRRDGGGRGRDRAGQGRGQLLEGRAGPGQGSAEQPGGRGAAPGFAGGHPQRLSGAGMTSGSGGDVKTKELAVEGEGRPRAGWRWPTRPMKNRALLAMAEALERRSAEILAENAEDVAEGRNKGSLRR